MFAFGEGAAKRILAGVIFSVGHGRLRREFHVVVLTMTSPALQL